MPAKRRICMGCMEPDRTNKRILAWLLRDARISAAAIGRAIGLSRPAVQGRIRAMEEAGVIQGYHATLGGAAGMIRAVLFVRIKGRPCDPALRWLAALEGVTAVASLAGEVDALVSVTVPDPAALSALNDRIAASPLIEAAQSHVVLRRYGSPLPGDAQ